MEKSRNNRSNTLQRPSVPFQLMASLALIKKSQ
jgi:hypothetical protein